MLVPLYATLTLAWLRLPAPQWSGRRAASACMQISNYDEATYNPEVSGLNVQAQNKGMPDGAHGTGFRFMPLATVSRESAAAVVCIAGAYPGITADQLKAPDPVPFAPPGSWNYHMLKPGASPGGFVAIPGSPLLDDNPDSVAVVCTSSSLGLEFPDNQEHEVLALINRGDVAVVDDSAMDERAFYALADPQGTLHIRWIDAIPEGWKIVGRLLFAQMPFVERPGKGSGFAETTDEFEF